ncbi:MAG: hypothetical protein O9320_08885 [Magnetospirillum sp.]|nr:hypothetical protein [Magnetospirillum sp.]
MVAAYIAPDNTSQLWPVWRSGIDAAIVAGARISVAFLPQAQDTPNMTVKVLAGALMIGGVLTEVAAQNTGTITAPVGNPRIDRVVLNPADGTIAVVTGTPGASPVAPAIPADRLPICRFQLATSTTAIANSMIIDERVLAGSGASGGGTATITAGEALSIRDIIYQDVFNQRGGGADRWYQVDTDAISPVRIGPRIGIALAAISSGASGTAQVRPGRVAGFSGLTAGQAVFAHTTAGGITQTAPTLPSSGTQNASRLIGYAASSTEIDFDPEDDTVFTGRNSSVAVDGTFTVQHWPDAGAREREQAAYIVQASAVLTTGTFGVATSSAKAVSNAVGQSLGFRFDATTTGTLTSARIDVNAVVSSGSWEARLYTNNAGSPGTQIGSSSGAQTISAAGAVTFTFGSPPSITSATTYWLVVTPTSGTPNIDVNACANQAGYGSGRNNTITSITDTSILGTEDWRVEINQSGSARDEPLTIGGSVANATATDRVNVRYDDGSGSNADTRTTFINRTNATRDLAVEVVL